ncbi:hypothetical protein B296_00022326 [Ensete ventricosum]|uniref:Uncharacterized protein n=1 Tax=Ensete ventricosum TaxID=4639 RepID=A0A426Y069_ENSVE|nr:hypothetical protein B296_00022326 [Ensete ventricosum]
MPLIRSTQEFPRTPSSFISISIRKGNKHSFSVTNRGKDEKAMRSWDVKKFAQDEHAHPRRHSCPNSVTYSYGIWLVPRPHFLDERLYISSATFQHFGLICGVRWLAVQGKGDLNGKMVERIESKIWSMEEQKQKQKIAKLSLYALHVRFTDHL